MDVRVTPAQGRIEVITGCMFSGKTEELIHRAQRAEIAGHNVVGFKPDIDERYEKNSISTHNGVNISATPIENNRNGTKKALRSIEYHNKIVNPDIDTDYEYVDKRAKKAEIKPLKPTVEYDHPLIDFKSRDKNIEVVVIDEVNLFDSSIVDMIRSLSEKKFRVIVSGLDLNFRGKPFEPTPKIMALADKIEKRQAICESCGDPATRTQRLIEGDPAPVDSPTIDVGSDEKYEPRCRNCHEI